MDIEILAVTAHCMAITKPELNTGYNRRNCTHSNKVFHSLLLSSSHNPTQCSKANSAPEGTQTLSPMNLGLGFCLGFDILNLNLVGSDQANSLGWVSSM